MKNLNTDIVFFTSADTPLLCDNAINFIDVALKYPLIPAIQQESESGILIIPQLTFMLSINALERLSSNDSNLAQTSGEEKVNLENKIFFDLEYELCLRLSETKSGKFVDLGKDIFTPKERSINFCRKVFSSKTLYQFYNINVVRPPLDKFYCVLKVLIRRAGSDSKWTVQSIHPIELRLDNQ